jgi:mRNA interferase MazF
LSRFQRGEVWLVDLGMTAKVRPCLVLSVPPGDADRALVTLVPHTTSVRASRFETPLRVPFLREGAFDAQGIVTVPHVKLLRKLGRLRSEQLRVRSSILGPRTHDLSLEQTPHARPLVNLETSAGRARVAQLLTLCTLGRSEVGLTHESRTSRGGEAPERG